ncbi:MAG: DNA sulfur modification protein DndD [Planctomycetaceae bacterium]
MILDELYLQNFCLYQGLHKFSLAPQKEKGLVKPITLFGGMNGAGKTTVLDAIQLALYGSRAKSASRLGKPYEEYLKECIHRGANSGEGASVSVKFHFHSEGQQHVYEVWRGWSLRDKSVRERVRVTKDDAPDDFLSEHWNDVVEDLVPLGISQLFFFDAEKIRFLADDETDTEALGTAIKSLLGLDLAERLISDAVIVERRLTDAALDHGDDERISQLQQALESKSTELTDAKGKRASLENPLLRSRNAMEEAKKAFQSAGGEHWTRRAELQVEIRDLERRIAETQSSLRRRRVATCRCCSYRTDCRCDATGR